MHDFNGFDLDWEFPTKRGGAPEDRENFVKLVKVNNKTIQSFDQKASCD